DDAASLLFSRVVLKNDNGITVHIDIFPMVGLPQNKLKQQIFIKLARLINGFYFFKKVNPEIHYKNQGKKIRISKLLKIIAFPIPSKLLIFMKEKLEKLYPINNIQYLFNLLDAFVNKELNMYNLLSN